jgi:Na+/H+ antiporter NhaD/arsenite permease-like protein
MSDIRVVITAFIQKEAVLVIAAILALASMYAVHPDAAYFDYLDWKVLACLFSLMAVVAGLRKGGFFETMAAATGRISSSLRIQALVLILSTFFISMFITNDVALITFVPFSLMIVRNVPHPVQRMHIIVLQTIAANVGSSLTPVGNPQNLYLFTYYQMEAITFFGIISPVVIGGGLLLALSVLILPNIQLDRQLRTALAVSHKWKTVIYVCMFVLAILAVFRIMDYRVATLVILATILIIDRGLLLKIDYSLLGTFIAFFIFIGNLQRIEPVRQFLANTVSRNVLLTGALASQAISNVPAAILLSPFTNDSASLLRGVSVGGMGTLIASLASVISYKFYANEHPGESGKYLMIFTIWNILFLVALYGVCLIA